MAGISREVGSTDDLKGQQGCGEVMPEDSVSFYQGDSKVAAKWK